MGGGSMNAASLINFFINKKILKIKNKELKNLTAKIGSDVILGIEPTNTILSSNGKIKKFVKKIKLYVLVVSTNAFKYQFNFAKSQQNSLKSGARCGYWERHLKASTTLRTGSSSPE